MRNIISTLIALLLLSSVSFAQFTEDVESVDELCGFRMTPEFEYQLDQNLKIMRSGNYQRSNTIKYAPVTFHLVGRTSGFDFYPAASALQRLCELNRQFLQAGIQFYLDDDDSDGSVVPPINYPKNDNWYAGTSMTSLFAFNKDQNSINIYIVGTAISGNSGMVVCGYYTGQHDVVVVQKNCYGTNNTTMMHELGHLLRLPHTFSGLESFPDYVCGQQVTTVYEKNDGSNCAMVADKFCDTGPDYQNERWNCTTQGVSTCLHVDANGDSFYPSGRFAMSYSNDACVNLFSGEQIDVMNLNYDNDRTNIHPAGTIISDTITAAPQLSQPENNSTTVGYSQQFFSWFPVPNATGYMFQLSKNQSFTGNALLTTIISKNPWLTYSAGLDQFTDYYWRVKPFNQGYFCTSFSSIRTFTTFDAMIAVNDIEGVSEVMLYPNPTNGINQVTLALNSDRDLNATVNIFAVDGKQLKSEILEIRSSENNYQIDIQGLSPGLYLLSLETKKGTIQEKLIISK